MSNFGISESISSSPASPYRANNVIINGFSGVYININIPPAALTPSRAFGARLAPVHVHIHPPPPAVAPQPPTSPQQTSPPRVESPVPVSVPAQATILGGRGGHHPATRRPAAVSALEPGDDGFKSLAFISQYNHMADEYKEHQLNELNVVCPKYGAKFWSEEVLSQI